MSSLRMSLIPETLAELEREDKDEVQKARAAKLEEKKLTRRDLTKLGVPSFEDVLKKRNVTLDRKAPEILQVNIGLYCNQACKHCHVESSPRRKEMMTRDVADRCLWLVRNTPSITTIDITGGAPELNDQFRYFVGEARKLGLEIVDRCNLTVLMEPGQEDLGEFLASHEVRVISSLPCYSAKNVTAQRGKGVFDKSIAALQLLNSLGYGTSEKLQLDLVYNPLGAFLPGAQEELEKAYKLELGKHFGIKFNSLFAITNLPMKRFADDLFRKGQLKEYMDLLIQNFNPRAVEGVMCRNHVSVNWKGEVFDCDFNQQLNMHLPGTVFTRQDLRVHEPIRTAHHCFGCTAGAGSSCQGTTV